MEYQTFDGLTFYRTDERGYFKCKLGQQTLLMHEYVWEKLNCKIPEGYEVCHKDCNRANNDIDNLQLRLIPVLRQQRRNNLEINARPKASEWHKSDVGRDWHKKQYEKTKDRLHQQVEHECLNCGKVFVGEIKNKYCSNACKSAYRRKMHLDDVEKTCVICGKTFVASKYAKVKTCSSRCKAALVKVNRGW